METQHHSNAQKKVTLQDMTWREISEALDRGFDTVIIMVGSIEQHGPHLPISTDTLIADELAIRMARKLGNALAAPTIRPGCSDHHMSLPGTISLRPEVLLDLLRDYCRCLARHGFKKIILASSHGGNFAPLETFTPVLVREFPQLRFIHYGDLKGFMEVYQQEVAKLGLEPEKAGGHACIGETSEILFLKPEVVRTDCFEPGYIGSLKGQLSRVLRDGIQVITKNGVLGDPRGATSEFGEAILEGVATHLAEWAEQELEG
ncbi:MAG: creatininase family protein [Candidatus Latescibacteria bacterium]|nr:creatininase family protein [Candidatus Latescibacterota bacterium]NIO27119.1 creatininase family protein [Candidatus Latescibacterota bacterium]NIO54643.1 creatininase family protein [Candidatus Latescibacterota bacterium]NIT00726.1 creatininase family protein [Candidatus Latescibacterota bacterium]NIT37649.1 creatininase family protein [Candidatus Latescibacterota bacterium]